MKNINFKKVYMENYCGYIEPMEFLFENSKITLISGKNGVGKSTVFSVIPFALYGITQTGQTATDVLNNKTEKNCKTECYFAIDNVNYKAVRGLKSPKAQVFAALFIDGKRDPIAKGAREVTNKIEELFVPKELFFNTVLFGQKVKSFFTDLPDSKQKEIFRKILQLDSYVDYQRKSSEKINVISDEISDIERIIDKIDASIDSLRFNIEKINNIISNRTVNHSEIKAFIEKLQNEKKIQEEYLYSLDEERENDQLQLLLDRKNSHENELVNLEALKNSKMSELSAQVTSKIAQLKEYHSTEISKCNNQLNDEINNIKNKLNQELADINKEISDLRENYLIEKNELSNKHNNAINNFNNLIQTKKDELRDIRDKFKDELNDILKNDHSQETKELNQETENFKNIEQLINDKINNLKNEISSLEKDLIIQKNKIDNSTNKIEQYEKSIELKSTICPTCHQPWDDVSHIQKSITKEKELLATFINIEKDIQSEITKYKQQIDNNTNDLKKDIDAFKICLDNIREKYVNVRNIHSDKIIELEQQQNLEYESILNKLISDKIIEEESYKTLLSELDNKYTKLADEQKQLKIDTEYKFGEMININESDNKNLIDNLDNRLNIAIETVSSKEAESKIVISKEFDDKEKELKDRIQNFEDNIVSVKHKIAVIESHKNKIKQTDDEINYANKELKQCEEDIQNNKNIIKETNDEITQKYNHKAEFENNIKDSKEKQKVCKFWKEAFSSSGIPSMLIDESIPFMNRQISDYLEQMSNGRYIVTFDTLHETKKGEFRDKISINVYDAETHSNSRVNLSGGQTKLIDIATILTLSDLQESVQKFKTNILLFDEIFDALDDENISNVSNMLRRILIDKSINIITHRHIDQVEADAIYNFG